MGLLSIPTYDVLGSRTITKGLFGNDVRVASGHLVKLGYLKASQIAKNSDDFVIFNDEMVEAVNAYEKDKGLPVDSQITEATAAKLAADGVSFRALGSRDLMVGMSGTDVTEMKNLLIEKGYINSEIINRFDSTLFSSALLEDLKRFLDDIGLDWEGKVDSQMVVFLKKSYDD